MANFRLSRKICICLVIVLIFSNSVFAVSISSSVNAQASYTRIGQFNQYITNNYGSQTADADTTLLIGMYQSLAKLAAPGVAYGIDRNNHSYYLTGTLTYLEEYLMQITENQYDIYKSEDTYLDGLSSVVSDIKTNTTNTAVSSSALTTIVSTDMWASLSYSPSYYDANFSQIQYSAYMNVGKDMYISTPDNTSISPNSILHIRLPISYMSNIQYLTIDFSSYRYGEITVPYYYVIPSMWQIDIYYIVPFNAVGSTYIHLHNDYGLRFTDTAMVGNVLCEYIGPNNSRYKEYLAIMFDYQNHREIMDAIDDINVNVEVNDSINVTPIDLDVSIGIEDFTAVNTISNKLRTWLTTGVSVSSLIGALDALDDSFFTLSNRNTIETINNQYTDFYD